MSSLAKAATTPGAVAWRGWPNQTPQPEIAAPLAAADGRL